MPEVTDLEDARRRRQDRRDVALLELFSAVLRTPLERRELTPDEQVARAERLREQRRRRHADRATDFPPPDSGGIIGV